MDLERLIKASQIAKDIQTTNIQAFILKNQKKYDASLLPLIADQWLAKQKSKDKLPTWSVNENVIFPPILSVEQASSETTSNYKAKVFFNFINEVKAKKCIDLTGGMGLDSYALAQVFESVTYIEQNSLLAQIAEYNFEVLGQKNIETINENSVSFTHSNSHSFTNYYLDPHRRDASKNKVFKIEECEPNILQIKHLFENYMVKFSPMLDIKLALEQLQNISEVHIVAVENEVKELLFLGKKTIEKVSIHCINFLSNGQKQVFELDYDSEQNAKIIYSKPQKYIYEPNASILKAGAFKSIANKLNINKLAPSSHLYTSETLLENFPGRSFICEAISKFDKKEILAKLTDNKANISTRNFPMKPEEIKKKLGLRDGGDYYLFATENHEKQKIVLICKKIVIEN
ncbi:THUMP-like domain-containing protein [Emticicia sp. SJ17W-69]|uniref:THUMP-like domain-containing protein n=1 Tax=Emticicia sp. SJ17W-69 TaxID=3421657 RepID=UPI003EBEEF28